MAEKKFGWGTVLLASGTAALVAGSVVAYLKREELKKFAEDVMSKVRPEDDSLFEYDDDLFEDEPDSEEEAERDIILTEDEDDEPADVEIEITIAKEDDAEDAPAKAAGEE